MSSNFVQPSDALGQYDVVTAKAIRDSEKLESVGDLTGIGAIGLKQGSMYAPNINFQIPFVPQWGDSDDPDDGLITYMEELGR